MEEQTRTIEFIEKQLLKVKKGNISYESFLFKLENIIVVAKYVDEDDEKVDYIEPLAITEEDKEYFSQTIHLMLLDIKILIDDNIMIIPDELEDELKDIEKSKLINLDSKVRAYNLYKKCVAIVSKKEA